MTTQNPGQTGQVRSAFNLPRPRLAGDPPASSQPDSKLNPYFERIAQAKEQAMMARAFSEAVDGAPRQSAEPPIRMNLDIGTIMTGSIAQAADARKDMLAIVRETNSELAKAQQARIDAMEARQVKLMEGGQNGSGPAALTAQIAGWREISAMFREMAEEILSKQGPAPVGDASVQVMLKKLDIEIVDRQNAINLKLEELKEDRAERARQHEFEKHKWELEREDARTRHNDEMGFKREQAKAEAAQKEKQGETMGVILKAVGATLDDAMGGAGGGSATTAETVVQQREGPAPSQNQELTSEEVTLPCNHKQVVWSNATTVKCGTCQAEYAAERA